MTKRTHVAAGAVVSLYLGMPIIPVLFTATLPDIDLTFTMWAKITHIKLDRIPHRTITHGIFTYLFLLVFSLILIPYYALPLLVGFVSHILLDFLTVSGVAIFYPFPTKIGLKMVKSNSIWDTVLFYIFSLVFLFGVFYYKLPLNFFKEYPLDQERIIIATLFFIVACLTLLIWEHLKKR
ncbi:MAG: metal-dependent hydrolase [Conexivisphaerales archaeon]